MNTHSFFQQYEQHRKRYKPGTIWKDKMNYHLVKEIQIVSLSEIDEESSIYYLYQGQKNVFFKILKVSRYNNESELDKGKIASWSTEYMNQNYEVLIND